MRVVFGSRDRDLAGRRASASANLVQQFPTRSSKQPCGQAAAAAGINRRYVGDEQSSSEDRSRKIVDEKESHYSIMGFSESVQRILGTTSPGLMPASRLQRCGGSDRIVRVGDIGLQVDVAFKVGREFPTAQEIICAEAASSAVAGVYAAIVVMGGCPSWPTRYGDVSSVELHLEAAPLEGVNALSNVDIHMVVTRRGRQIWNATSMLVRPIDAFTWGAERLRKEGGKLKAGDVVSAGTFPLLLDIKPGDQLVVEFVCPAVVETYRWLAL